MIYLKLTSRYFSIINQMIESKSRLLKDKMFFSAYIISTQVNKSIDRKEYVEYIIKMNILFNNWIIKKRYSDFFELNNKLKGRIENLPILPNKRLFFNCCCAVINERIKIFDDYLSFLIKKVDFIHYQDIVNFLEISDDIINQFSYDGQIMTRDIIEYGNCNQDLSINSAKGDIAMTKKSEIENTAMTTAKGVKQRKDQIHERKRVSSNLTIGNSTNNRYEGDQESFTSSSSPVAFNDTYKYINTKNYSYSKIQYKATFLFTVIEDFLFKLNNLRENLTQTIKGFEEYIIEEKQWPKFTQQEIMLLFIGNIDRNIKGLFYFIGLVNENQLGAQRCLRLFSKLINYELNPNCDMLVSVFKSIPIELLEQMKLNDHINANNLSVIIDCFQIIEIYLDNRITIKALDFLVKDKKTSEHFIDWLEMKFVK